LHQAITTANGLTGEVSQTDGTPSVLTLDLSTVDLGKPGHLLISFDWTAAIYDGGEFQYTLTLDADPLAGNEIVTDPDGTESGHAVVDIDLLANFDDNMTFDQQLLNNLQLHFTLSGTQFDWATIKNLAVTLTHQPPTDLARNNRLRNTKERDASIGLDNDGFRYYDPATATYVQRDPLGYADGMNVYTSVHDNPMNNVDPLGLATADNGYMQAMELHCLAGEDRAEFQRKVAQLPQSGNGTPGYDAHTGTPLGALKQGGLNTLVGIGKALKFVWDMTLGNPGHNPHEQQRVAADNAKLNARMKEFAKNRYTPQTDLQWQANVQTAELGTYSLMLGGMWNGPVNRESTDAAEGNVASVPAETTAPAPEPAAAVPGDTTAPLSHPTFQPGSFAGESIPATSSAQMFTPAERAQINAIGSRTGCHTCGTRTPGTKSGNFIPDHQPVSALNAANAPQRLYPHCLNCSREQGLAVARAVKQQASQE
jgi:RHS repeat-associated protein